MFRRVAHWPFGFESRGMTRIWANKKAGHFSVTCFYGGKRGIWARCAVPWGRPLRDKAAKNSPPGCFLYAAYPFGFESRGMTRIWANKKAGHFSVTCFYGGKRGIRTLGGFVALTRFPVVRLRPAQPSFHVPLKRCLYIIPRNMQIVNRFFQKNSRKLKKYKKPVLTAKTVRSGGKSGRISDVQIRPVLLHR